MARIAFLLPDFDIGGAERVALTLITELVERGHEVDLVLMEKRGELVSLVPPQVTLVDLGAKKMRGAVWPLVGYLRRRRPDGMQVRMWPLTIVGILAARLARTGTRVVTSDHGILSKQYGGSRRTLAALKATTRWFYPLAAGRICVSEGCAADLSSLSGMPIDRLTVIHNPVPSPPEPIDVPPQVERLWGDGHCPRILTVGTLTAVKNHALLLRAFALLSRNPEARLMILGEGPERPKLEQLARELGIAEQVVMPGFAKDPWPYYASADLFALSSDHEGYGNVLIEALHHGLTVVSTDCPMGPSEILDGGRLGYLAPCGNPDALAGAIERALDHRFPADALRARAEELSGPHIVDDYIRLLLHEHAR